MSNVELSERSRTAGIEKSFKSSYQKHLAAVKTGLQDEINAVHNAVVLSNSEITALMDKLKAHTEKLLESSDLLNRLAIISALEEERELDKKILNSRTSSEHVAAICSALASRKALCEVCQSVSEQIAAFLLVFDNDAGEAPKIDEIWPPRENLDRKGLRAYTDGLRLLPPEAVKRGDTLPPNVIQHHTKAGSLLESAEDCPFCELIRVACILDAFRERGYPFDHSRASLATILAEIRLGTGGSVFKRVLRDVHSSSDPIFLMAWGSDTFDNTNPLTLGEIRLIWQRPASSSEEKDRRVVFTRLNVFRSIDSDPALARYISPRQPLRNSGSSDALNQLRCWLKGCQARHESCRRTISRGTLDISERHKLPTRLLDLGPSGSDDKPRLVDTTRYQEGNWAALSHCWGDPQNHPLKTTRKTLSHHMNGIPLSSLPKTFLDAIVVTEALGLRYLWIDSLCIIQDDEDDWLAESKTMGTVYERAVITLAASTAPDSTHGLFLERPYSELQVPSVQLPFIRGDTTSGVQEVLGHYSVGIEWRQEPFMTQMDPTETPLSKRAWATQEWILSRRVVHFLDQGMVWVCRCRAEDESGQQIIGRGLPNGDWAPEWDRIIQEHSAREFTYEKDRLVSLEGLAREIAKTKSYKDNYCFGTWEIDMPECLLWSPIRRGKKLTICPSWSWASSPGPVWLRFRDFDNHRQDYCFGSCCRILGVDQALGTLNIKAKRKEIHHLLTRKTDKVEYSEEPGYLYRTPLHQGYVIGLPDEDPSGWAEFDDGRDVDGSEPIFFLHLATVEYWKDPKLEHYGLLLVKNTAQEEVYNRVGIGTAWDVTWMADASDVSTRIV